jgi:Tfp pilus assembly protein PilF
MGHAYFQTEGFDMTPSYTRIEEAIEFAAQAIDRGDIKNGRSALSWVLRQSPAHPVAWMWMAVCVDDEAQKQECYRRISG